MTCINIPCCSSPFISSVVSFSIRSFALTQTMPPDWLFVFFLYDRYITITNCCWNQQQTKGCPTFWNIYSWKPRRLL
jgi:hypothetical protein